MRRAEMEKASDEEHRYQRMRLRESLKRPLEREDYEQLVLVYLEEICFLFASITAQLKIANRMNAEEEKK